MLKAYENVAKLCEDDIRKIVEAWKVDMQKVSRPATAPAIANLAATAQLYLWDGAKLDTITRGGKVANTCTAVMLARSAASTPSDDYSNEAFHLQGRMTVLRHLFEDYWGLPHFAHFSDSLHEIGLNFTQSQIMRLNLLRAAGRVDQDFGTTVVGFIGSLRELLRGGGKRELKPSTLASMARKFLCKTGEDLDPRPNAVCTAVNMAARFHEDLFDTWKAECAVVERIERELDLPAHIDRYRDPRKPVFYSTWLRIVKGITDAKQIQEERLKMLERVALDLYHEEH